jgi:hypothetical protein
MQTAIASVGIALVLAGAVGGGGEGRFVRVSSRDPRYFELSDGSPFVPIGLNMIAPPGGDVEEGLEQFERWVRRLSENRGNFIRLWLGHRFLDVEHAKSGDYDDRRAERLDAVLEIARRHGVRVKMTLEHFRHLGDGRQRWAAKTIHHVSNGGPAEDIVSFFRSPRSRAQFKRKLDWYEQRYGDDPTIFAWELWNEFNAVQNMWTAEMWRERGGLAYDWTQTMLAALHGRFPKNLATQSLGSFDRESKTALYRSLCTMPNNDFAQVHRYLDLGAELEICRGPVDVLAADAVTTLLGFDPGKPVLLAESGAVEASHSGPFKHYAKDKAGIILHDVLFAPFFAGAAGAGQCWHWDHYVARNDLWHHFARFAEAIEGLDLPAERFEPVRIQHPRLRIYALVGKSTFLAWCRDKQNTWTTELAEGREPDRLTGLTLTLPQAYAGSNGTPARFYDPWLNAHGEGTAEDGILSLRSFARSIVVRIEH